MAFFEDTDKLLEREQEKLRQEQEELRRRQERERPQDEANLVIADEIRAMGREYVAAMEKLGVEPDTGGFHGMDGMYGMSDFSVNREGAYLYQPRQSGGKDGPPVPFNPYRPGMGTSLASLRDTLRTNMAKSLSSAAARRVRQED